MILDYLGTYEVSVQGNRVTIPRKLRAVYRGRNPDSDEVILKLAQFHGLTAILFIDSKYFITEKMQCLQQQKLQIKNNKIIIPKEFLKKVNPNLEDRLVFTGAIDYFLILSPSAFKKYEEILDEKD